MAQNFHKKGERNAHCESLTDMILSKKNHV